MDDLIQILIILFFIITSIVSAVKKKKKEPEVKPRVSDDKRPASNSQKSTQQILEQILGVRTPGQDSIPQPVDTYERSQQTWNPEDEFKTEKDYSVKQKNIYDEIVKAIPSKSRRNAESISYRDSSRLVKEKEYSKKAHRISNLIKNNANIKDYILISEILGKPKALRR